MNVDSVKFNLGDVVYLKIRNDRPGMVTGIMFRPAGVSYYVEWGSGETSHFDIELTKQIEYVVEK